MRDIGWYEKSLGRFPRLVVSVAAIVLCAGESALAQSPAERRGLRFAHLHCAQCHAIEATGESPLPTAPPFRTLQLKYPVEDLQRPLAEGVHPKMPLFQLTPAQAADLMAYLKTLEPANAPRSKTKAN
jgi:mono/diheme cytochrome c family protein